MPRKYKRVFRKLTNTTFKKLLLTTFITFLVIGLGKILFNTASPAFADALISFNEGSGTTIYDVSGNVSGTLSNATWQTDDKCIFDKCLYFNGTSSYAEVNDTNNALDASGDFTLMAWVRLTSDTAGTKNIASKGDTSSSFNYYLDVNASEYLEAGFYGDSGVSPSSRALGINRWHHVAAVFSDSGNTIYYYIDGVSAGSFSVTGSPTANNGSLDFGAFETSSGSYSEYFPGFIDEVKIYPTEAKTEAEVKAEFLRATTDKGTSASFGKNNSTLSDGLIGYWKMNESSWTGDCSTSTVIDSSGNNVSGTACPNGSATSPTVGKFGNSASLNGTTQYINLGSGFNFTTSFTVSAWINSDVTNPESAIVTNMGGSGDRGWGLYYDWDGIAFHLPTDASNTQYHYAYLPLTTNTWYHVTAVYNASTQTARIYANGEDITYSANLTPPTSLYNPSNDTNIGRAPAGFNYFDGEIDEVRLYNRPLSPSEITNIYNFAEGPVAYWNMDENVTSTVYDRSTNGLNLGSSSSWSDGKFGSAWNGDGTNWLSLSDNDKLDFAAIDNFTFSLWVKSDSVTNPSANEYFIAKTNTATPGYVFAMTNAGQVVVAIDDDSTWSPTSDDYLVSTADIYDNTWHHVAFVKQGTSRIDLYIDGVLDQSDTSLAATGTLASSIDLYLGDFSGADNGNEFVGDLDDIKVYRYARTAEQIVEDMNGGHPSPGSPIGSELINLKFDEGYGDTANDSGPLNKDGNLADSTACPGNNTCPDWTNSGKSGKALTFEGALDKLSTPLITNLTDNFSFSTWVNWTGGDSTDQNIFFNGVDGSNGWLLKVNSSNNYLYIICENNDTVTSTQTLSTGVWQHIVVQRVSGTWELYLDGKEITLGGGTTCAPTTPTTRTMIGSVMNQNYAFNGSIDEVMAFAFALDIDQIRTMYNQGVMTVMGATSTDSSGNATWSAQREYCPPGNTEGRCGSGDPSPLEWKFDENTGTTARDNSGYGIDGTLHNTAKYLPGKFGSAVYLDGDITGNDTHVQFPDSAFSTITEGTISLWYKSNLDASAADWQEFLGAYHPNSGALWELAYEISTNRIHVWSDDATCSNGYISGPNNPHGWHHLVLTVDSTGRKFYLDGILKTETGTPSDTCFFGDFGGTGDENYALGCYNYGASPACNGEHFRGYIDNFRIYDYARTASQVAWEYNRGEPIAYWKMDETAANTCTGGVKDTCDSSGNGYDLTWADQATFTTGKFNNGTTYQGTNDYISCTDADCGGVGRIEFGAGADFSWGGWFKTTSAPSLMQIGGKRNSNGTSTAGWAMELISGKPSCWISDGFIHLVPQTTAAYNDGNWHHSMCVMQNEVAYLYVDGILVASDADDVGNPMTGSNSFENTDPFKIGEVGNGNQDYTGDIDEYRVYNYALNATQIKTLYNQGAATLFR